MAETSAWHPTEARTDDPARYAVPSNFLLWSGVILGILFLLLKHRLPQRAGPTA
jgi:hypothetical protein